VRGEARPEPAKRTRRPRTKEEAAPAKRSRNRRRGPQAVRDEILRLGGRRGERQYQRLTEAADAFARDHERDAVRILTPLRDQLPESPTVRELLGLSLYRLGRWAAAVKELDTYHRLTGEVDQHPVLMDCERARGNYDRVDELWRELADVSPSGALMTEGRIVLAGSLAERGRLDEAVAMLEQRAGNVKKVRDDHLRLWYALADLQERVGNVPRARILFEQVRRHDAGFADVAERLAALS
jgi:tetratricopeptide (TPR) repeat protein